MLKIERKKFNINLYISTLIIIFALIVILFLMYKYNVEGEAVPPFKISKMIVISTAKTKNLQLQEGMYTADVLQNNDIKISIEKNPEYKKEEIIKKVVINNIQINNKNTPGDVEIYRPSKDVKLYDYIDEYKIHDKIEYDGEQETYVKGDVLQIANQGGIIDFSIVLNNLGAITYNENEVVSVDGTLLKRLNLNDVDYEVDFDLIVELESGIKLKTKISLNLPAGNILENGIETNEEENMKTVFKRI